MIRMREDRRVYRDDMTQWRTSHLVAGVVIALFLIVQLTIPIVQAGSDAPERFAWQMFSKGESAPDFVIVLSNGETQPIELADYVAAGRAEIDYDEYMPPHLCSVIPDAVEITWEEGAHRC